MNQKFEIYLNRARKFKWRLREGNGEIIATCGKQDYTRRIDCMSAIKLVRQSDLARIVDLTKGD